MTTDRVCPLPGTVTIKPRRAAAERPGPGSTTAAYGGRTGGEIMARGGDVCGMIGRQRSGGIFRVVGSRRSSGPNKLLTGYIVLSCWRNEWALSGKVQNTIHHLWMDGRRSASGAPHAETKCATGAEWFLMIIQLGVHSFLLSCSRKQHQASVNCVGRSRNATMGEVRGAWFVTGDWSTLLRGLLRVGKSREKGNWARPATDATDVPHRRRADYQRKIHNG